jgi:D-amino-acid oxidase
VLGGTAQRGDTRTSPDDADTAVILASLQRHLPALRGARVRAVRVGLRPWRRTVRLELERLPGGRRLVHDYGHGGSGYTLSWGCAAEVARLLGTAG